MDIKKMLCPCDSDKQYIDCCGLYLEKSEVVPTAEALMRSRYTAYTLGREDYLLSTWCHKTRPTTLGLANDSRSKWLGLEVRCHEQTAPDHALVEFVARYKVDGRVHRMHEVSRFVFRAGQWFYVDGNIISYR